MIIRSSQDHANEAPRRCSQGVALAFFSQVPGSKFTEFRCAIQPSYTPRIRGRGNALLRRMTVKTTLAIVLFGILCAGSGTVARAVCTGTSVHAFGAKGDGQTDDTAAIQSAINAASSAGGGSVVFNVPRYFPTGSFVVPAAGVLCGTI